MPFDTATKFPGDTSGVAAIGLTMLCGMLLEVAAGCLEVARRLLEVVGGCLRLPGGCLESRLHRRLLEGRLEVAIAIGCILRHADLDCPACCCVG